MHPLHPCPMCGHEFAAECRDVAHELPAQVRVHCPHCRDECIPILRAGTVPHEPLHSPGPLLAVRPPG